MLAAPSACEPYQSSSLATSRKQIRLFDVAAPDSLAEEGAEVYGLLRIVDLDSKPAYDAISYVWGDRTHGKDDSFVRCGSDKINLTWNGFCAIKHLRNKLGGLTLWIDAVCIDQQDETEVLHQVQLMKDIYCNAQKVYVWLGHGDAAIDRAIEVVPHLGFCDSFKLWVTWRCFPVRCCVVLKVWFSLWASRWCRWSKRNRHDEFRPSIWRSSEESRKMNVSESDVERLYDNQWLSRIWTYQEIMLAKEPVLVYGHVHVPWDQFILTVLYLGWTDTWEHVLTPWQRLALGRVECLRRLGAKPSLDLERIAQYKQMLGDVSALNRWLTNPFLTAALCLFLFVEENCVLSLMVLAWIQPKPFPLATKVAWTLIATLSTLAMLILFLSHHRRRYAVKIPELAPEWSGPISTPVLSENLLETLRNRTATSGKDFNYGVRAIIEVLTDTTLPAPASGLSGLDVYEDLSSEILKRINSPYPLMMAPLTKYPRKPSWVVNWPEKTQQTESWHAYIMKACTFSTLNATAGSSPGWEVCAVDKRRLRARAHILGRVCQVEVVDCATVPKASTAGEAEVYRSVMRAMSILSTASTDDDAQDLPHVCKCVHVPSLQDTRNLCEAEANYHFTNIHRVPEKVKIHESVQDSTRNTLQSKPDQGCELALYESTSIEALPWRFCRKMHDSDSAVVAVADLEGTGEIYTGIAHRNVRVDDLLVLFAGIPLPMVARHMPDEIPDSEKGNTSSEVVELVSPAGIRGIMRGEAWDFEDGQELPLLTIV